MHSIRVTLATYGHTPYTCVYTPTYPVILHGLLGYLVYLPD
nr:MAG TPA: hypothetical protein [Caudoviricetes sp.]